MRTFVLVLLFSLLVVILELAGAFAPGPADWGVHHYGFLPRLWLLAGGIGALALFLLAWLRGARAGKSRMPAAIGVAAVAVAGAAIFWFARERTHFLGNGGFWIEGMQKGTPAWRLEPASVLAVFGLSRLGGFAGPAALFAWTSVASGVVYLMSAFFFARTATRDAWGRAVIFGVAALAGGTRLFYGHVETIPLLVAVVVLYLTVAARYLRGSGGAWGPVVLAAAAPWFHPAGVLLLPSLAYLLWVGPGSPQREMDKGEREVATGGRKAGPSRRGARLAGLIVPVAAVLVEWVVLQGRSGGGSDSLRYALGTFLPLSGGGGTAVPYTLFQAAHFRDFFQEQLLLGPFGALFVLLLLVFRSGGGLGRIGRFLLWAGIPWWVLSFLFHHPIGASRDWASFAAASVPFLFLAGLLLARIPWRWDRRRLAGATAGLVLGASLFHLLPWVVVGTDAERSVARFAVLFGPRSPASPFACSYAFEEIGAWYLDRGDADDAVAALREATMADSTNIRAARNLVGLLLIQGKTAEAANALRVQARRIPGGEALYLDLGNAYLASGKVDDAIPAFRSALEINPDYIPAYDGLTRAEQAKGDLKAARDVLEKAKTRFPENAGVRKALGSVLISLDEPEKAVAEYRRALELDPDDSGSAYELGRLLLARREPEEARDWLSRVVKRQPKNGEAWSNLGVAEEMMGDLAEAAASFQRAVTLAPSRPEPTFNLARVSIALGDTTQAVNLMRSWTERDSTSNWAKVARGLLMSLRARTR